MAKLDTKNLRDCATNIHSIGPDRAAGLLVAAAETIDALRSDLHEARLRKIHVPGGFRSAMTTEGEPAAFVTGEERGCPPGNCRAEPRCRNRAEMRAAHGTPDEFELAIMRAAPELSVAEADHAVASYRAAWASATEPDAALQRALNSELAAMHCDPASATQSEFKQALDRATRPRGSISVIGDPALIGAPSLAIAEQFDAEVRAAAEEPGTPGDGVREEEYPRTQAVLDDMAEHRRQATAAPPGVDLWPGSGLPSLLSATTKAALKSPAPAVDPMEDYDRAHESMTRDANLRRMCDEHKGET